MSWFSNQTGQNDLKNKFELLLKSSNDLVIILDEQNKVVDVNDRVSELFNIRPGEVLGRKINELPFLDSDSSRNSDFLSSLSESDNGYSVELDCLDRYKNKIILEATINGVKKSKVVVFKGTRVIGNLSAEEEGLHFLSESSLKLLELLPEKDIYQYVANQLASIIPDSYIFINVQETETLIRTVASATSSKVLGRGIKIIGGTPIGKTFKVSEKAQFSFRRGKILKVAGGVYELTFGAIPKSVAILAEKAAGIKSIYNIGFFWKGELFGNATIITRKEADEPENAGIIETFINLASVALQRRKAEDQLKLTIAELDQEKIKAIREKDKLDTILHSIGDGVVVVDEAQKIILANETAINILGTDTLFSRKFSEALEFVDDKEGQLDDFVTNCMKTGEVIRIANKALLALKEDRLPVDLTVSPLRDGDNTIGCVVVFRDATQVREIDRAKSEFVSLASHQLRSPLAAINWYTEILLDKGDKLDKEQKEYVEEISSSSKRMNELVKSLLNVSRLELGTFVVAPRMVNLKDTAESVLKELAPKIAEKNQKITKDLESLNMNADTQLIRIIIQNLLTNALKYSPKMAEIEISVKKSGSAEKAKIRLCVKDNGYGIPKKQQSQIFTKLFRADNIKLKEIDGNGLGLYIIKSIVDNSGGKIWFESEEGQGTTFNIEYPASGMIKKSGTKTLN